MSNNRVEAYEFSKECYVLYGAYVNGHRSFPRIEDGLKLVQRDLIYTAHGMSDSIQKCASLVGTCMSKYHPHSGEAMYGALTRMIRNPNSPFIGQGNFGSSTGLIRTGAAAFRYTGAKLSPIGKEALKFVKFSEYYENELGNREPVYLPTPVPFAMLYGESGIGVGAINNILPFSKDSVNKAVKAILLNEKKIPDLVPCIDNGECVIDEENLRSINDHGYGSVTIKAKVTEEYSKIDGKEVVVITGMPERLSPARLFAIFRDELEDGSVEIRDESSESTCIKIVRKPKLKKFTESLLRDKVTRAMSKKVAINMQVSCGEYIKRVTPKEWLKVTISRTLEAYKKSLQYEIDVLSLELKFQEVKKTLVNLIQNEISDDNIKKELNLTNDEYRNFTSRSLSQLRKDKDTKELLKKKTELLDKMNNKLALSYYEDHYKNFSSMLKD